MTAYSAEWVSLYKMFNNKKKQKKSLIMRKFWHSEADIFIYRIKLLDKLMDTNVINIVQPFKYECTVVPFLLFSKISIFIISSLR